LEFKEREREREKEKERETTFSKDNLRHGIDERKEKSNQDITSKDHDHDLREHS